MSTTNQTVDYAEDDDGVDGVDRLHLADPERVLNAIIDMATDGGDARNE